MVVDIRGDLCFDSCVTKHLSHSKGPIGDSMIQLSDKSLPPSSMADMARPYQCRPMTCNPQHHLLSINLLTDDLFIAKAVLKGKKYRVFLFKGQGI